MYSKLHKIEAKIIFKQTKKFAKAIRKKKEIIISILLKYESFEVANDEIRRSLDLLENLNENKDYFGYKIDAIGSFLPRNQPLYSLCCFVIIPSFMARNVYFRPPTETQKILSQLIKELNLKLLFHNIFLSVLNRQKFISYLSTLLNNKKGENLNAIIFTGTSDNADKIIASFKKKALIIVNGFSHNPIVVSDTADIKKALQSVLRAQLYNSGQDCAAPNSILVNKKIYKKFYNDLKNEILKTKIGLYNNKTVRVGPLSDRRELPIIKDIVRRNNKWIDVDIGANINEDKMIVSPILIQKPLDIAPNYIETFAPIFFVQKYNADKDLKKYFENPVYYENAGYISIFGKSRYIENLLNVKINGESIIHDESTIVRNTDLHEPGIERGVKPYGGYGKKSSFIFLRNRRISKPTLPQRDIFEYLIKPNLLEKD